MKSAVYEDKDIHTWVVWVVTPYNLVGKYQRFQEIHCLHLQFINPRLGDCL